METITISVNKFHKKSLYVDENSPHFIDGFTALVPTLYQIYEWNWNYIDYSILTKEHLNILENKWLFVRGWSGFFVIWYRTKRIDFQADTINHKHHYWKIQMALFHYFQSPYRIGFFEVILFRVPLTIVAHLFNSNEMDNAIFWKRRYEINTTEWSNKTKQFMNFSLISEWNQINNNGCC